MNWIDNLLFKPKNKPKSTKVERLETRRQEKENSYLIEENAPSPLAVIYKSELDYLSRCVLDYPNIETGGQLFGFWTNQGVPVVLYAIGPGHNANHQPAFFNQDKEYLSLIGTALLDKYGLCHIGEWHSHHQIDLARPSGHDARTMHNGLIKIPQRRFLLCICNYEKGCSTVNPYNFHENDLRGYADAAWQVIDMDSPYRKLADKEFEDILIHPKTKEPKHGQNRVFQIPTQTEEPERPRIKIPDGYWLNNEGNINTLKQMVELTHSLFDNAHVDTQANEKGLVQLHVAERNIDLRFTIEFPKTAPEVYMRENLMSPDAQWVVPADDNEIYKSYETWIRELFSVVN